MAGVRARTEFWSPSALIGTGLLVLLFAFITPRAWAGSINLAWNAVTNPPAAGYKVHYGPSVGNYTTHIDVGNRTTYTVTGLTEGATYHFAITAYAPPLAESNYSNDVGATVAYSVPVAQFTGSPTSGTSPLTVAFSNTSTGTITSYAWTFGDGGTSTAASPSHVYGAAGNYTVKLTVTGPGGSNAQTRTSYISVSGAAPVAQFTGTPTSGTSPLTVNFSNTSTGSITSYAWTFGDGGTSTAVAPSHVYAAAGNYTVKLTVTGPGGSNTQTRTNYISVSAPPVAQFSGGPTTGPYPRTVTFSNTSTGSITSYAWTFGDGGTSTAAAPSHSYAAPGKYTVSLTVTGPGGSNTQTRTGYVTVTRDAGLYRKLVFGSSTPLYSFLLDFNFNHVPEAKIAFGAAGDKPLVGNMSPGGKASLVVYRNGTWYVDTNRDGTTNTVVGFGGMPGDIPLTANFSGPGQLDDLVIYRAGNWYVDTNLSGTADLTYMFGGLPGDIPLAGDVNGDGMADLAIYRNGIWYIDTNRNGTADMVVVFGGMPQDKPALFDWDGDGKADLCIFRDGVWYISTKRDGVADVIFSYGAAGDLPFIGNFH
jgi:PKD repeat protein